MTCRRCKTSYDADANRACPKCGEPRTRPVFLKTSTILISTSETEAVYRSLEDVPAALRTVLLETTNGRNSATILIADRKGREEIARATRRIPGADEEGARKLLGGAAPSPSRVPARPLRIAAALIVLLLVALVLWAVCARAWG